MAPAFLVCVCCISRVLAVSLVCLGVCSPINGIFVVSLRFFCICRIPKVFCRIPTGMCVFVVLLRCLS